ncbi:hypothetical protein THAOC_01947 [Thalassiosira oceanica]|uniref:J domain-containing protein n=1 Tax=Thalassiosira oceanica TaxID=159749 RepID=K0TQM3_THAOC|nr:hypothetical protein THAOC_01947 [Thalassiosira oceanica]|eukprot:EJK76297.1 hypothetical protein THAOC_01947 [Thalassiosira oceanica]
MGATTSSHTDAGREVTADGLELTGDELHFSSPRPDQTGKAWIAAIEVQLVSLTHLAKDGSNPYPAHGEEEQADDHHPMGPSVGDPPRFYPKSQCAGRMRHWITSVRARSATTRLLLLPGIPGKSGGSPTPRRQKVGVGRNLFDFDSFGLLGLGLDATEMDVKTAYRMLALQYHPDKNDPENELA